MYWEIVYKPHYEGIQDKNVVGSQVLYVNANTEKGAKSIFRHIRGDSFFIVSCKWSGC